MSSNTTKRILSAIVLATIVAICIVTGTKSTLGFMLVASIIAVDEIYCNFLKKKRFDQFYLLSQILFIAPFAYLNFVDRSFDLVGIFNNAALVQNFLLLLYLFYLSMNSRFVLRLGNSFPFIAGSFILLPMMALASLLYFPQWRELLAVLLLVTIGMDTGAWFFGKNFGKRKLWEKVSPKKTIEGLIGGALTAGLLGTLSWQVFFGLENRSIAQLFSLFFLLGVLSQLGDLIQSKLKRQFQIKDSGALIPGHGGVYDRIDSLLFLAPFFVVVLKYFSFK